ncbi:MAG: hypothetical protein LCH74_03805 [Proteobacteria bacterium]|nr:hypothetical protein [Pseudomonadota bacterium]
MGVAMAYQTYWERISRFERVIFFLFALFSAVGAISSLGFMLIWIGALRAGGRVWDDGIYLSVMAMLSIFISLSYVLIAVLRSANPAFWAKRAIIPVVMLSLPLAALFVEAFWIDMNPKPPERGHTVDY